MPTVSKHDYLVIDLPAPGRDVLDEFEQLPFDPYTGHKQRYRRFSQYRISYADAADRWTLELLPHRPFIQEPTINRLVGGVPRQLEPLRIDPSPQIDAGAKALDLDRSVDWQINVHQCRVIANDEVPGISVPEGPHRDGHEFGMLAVFARRNIRGGENQLMPSGGGEPFFRVTLEPNQALVYRDTTMWHYATQIEALDHSGGHRDLWIVAFNRWDRRQYGDEFERRATAPADPR